MLLDKKDLAKVYRRSFFCMSSINYERFQGLGFLFAIKPALRKIYDNDEEYYEALKRHNVMYNSHPFMISPILGSAIALEEKNLEQDVSAAINPTKVGLMGPLAGLGDSIIWGTYRPIIGGICATIALSTQTILGAVIFLVLWNIMNFWFRYYSLNKGYSVGTKLMEDTGNTNVITSITTGAGIVGMAVIGVLVSEWVTINTGIAFTLSEGNVIALQDMLDQLVPNLIPLCSMYLFVFLLKKKIKPTRIIMAVFVVCLLIAFLNYQLGFTIIGVG